MLWPILHNLYDPNCQVCSNTTPVLMSEKQKVTDLNYTMNTPLNKHKHSFPIRVVSLWNSLPEKIALAPTLNQFKT